ncbi:hypothetical protein [Thiomonas sp. FB-6]|uniref:hypothetical protein n=1 Tax=Thiomonas sp. FB-6 TaxID=1158291 RepID=UPI000360E75F|nr:hypothetical protein [Thiomonas sp. FB-6]
MGTDAENLILEHLKQFQAAQSRLDHRFDEVILRLGHLERGIAHLDEACALLSLRMDKLVERVARIERRLELA